MFNLSNKQFNTPKPGGSSMFKTFNGPSRDPGIVKNFGGPSRDPGMTKTPSMFAGTGKVTPR
jgi:hypothetical protein